MGSAHRIAKSQHNPCPDELSIAEFLLEIVPEDEMFDILQARAAGMSGKDIQIKLGNRFPQLRHMNPRTIEVAIDQSCGEGAEDLSELFDVDFPDDADSRFDRAIEDAFASIGTHHEAYAEMEGHHDD